MNIAGYLARIGYRGALTPSAETLPALQRAHLLSVPFENLDIGRGVPIVLDPGAIYGKIVERRRGGFCYELNGLFHLLLTSLGFPSSMVSARVFDQERRAFGPEFDHLALIVGLPDGRRLVDVGFGDFSMLPLGITIGEPLDDPSGVFRFDAAGVGNVIVSRRRREGDVFEPQYDFTTTPRRLADFEGMCGYHQTSPDSHFTRGAVCSMATPDGRITLTADRLIETPGPGAGRPRTETPVRNKGAYLDILRRRFGIIL